MIYNYVVTLKNQQTRYLDIIGLLLSFISIVCFIEQLLKSQDVGFAYLLGSLFVASFLAWNVYQSRIKHRKVYYSRALLISALVWMKMPYFQWLSFALIILALLEYQAKYAIEIGFSEREIVMNTLLKKRYRWQQLTNVVLKDGLLTMDFVSNKVLQREVEDDEEDDAEEEEFNAFCQQCLLQGSV